MINMINDKGRFFCAAMFYSTLSFSLQTHLSVELHFLTRVQSRACVSACDSHICGSLRDLGGVGGWRERKESERSETGWGMTGWIWLRVWNGCEGLWCRVFSIEHSWAQAGAGSTRGGGLAPEGRGARSEPGVGIHAQPPPPAPVRHAVEIQRFLTLKSGRPTDFFLSFFPPVYSKTNPLTTAQSAVLKVHSRKIPPPAPPGRLVNVTQEWAASPRRLV